MPKNISEWIFVNVRLNHFQIISKKFEKIAYDILSSPVKKNSHG